MEVQLVDQRAFSLVLWVELLQQLHRHSLLPQHQCPFLTHASLIHRILPLRSLLHQRAADVLHLSLVKEMVWLSAVSVAMAIVTCDKPLAHRPLWHQEINKQDICAVNLHNLPRTI